MFVFNGLNLCSSKFIFVVQQQFKTLVLKEEYLKVSTAGDEKNPIVNVAKRKLCAASKIVHLNSAKHQIKF